MRGESPRSERASAGIPLAWWLVLGSSQLGILAVSLLALACGKSSRVPASTSPGGGGSQHTEGDAGQGPDSGKGGESGQSEPSGGAGSSGQPELSYVALSGSPIYTRVQRLTNRQWENAVTDILRFSESHRLSEPFLAPVAGVTDFDNNEKVLFVDPTTFADFESGAEAAAAIATGSAESLTALYDGNDAEGFVRSLGRRAFRRPLTEDEAAKYQNVFALGEALYGAGFANGAALVIRAMLQSPHFLYRTELGPAGDPLSAYEIASKLSFWLLGTTPSDSLLDAAAAGELEGADDLEAVAREMLETPRAVEVMRDFHGQLLRIRYLESVAKSGVPEYDPAINSELELASYAFFDRVFQQDFGLNEILKSKQAYVGAGLARLYGVGALADGIELRELDASRSGYFMQVPFLMLWGMNGESDPIRRGLALKRMLCGPELVQEGSVPPVPPLGDGQTNRERITELTAGCGGTCHGVYIDPLGFAFENFDGLGRLRDTDHGQPVDTTGSYPFAEGVRSFADGNELMDILAGSAQAHTCYAKNVTGYALGRDLVESDRPLLEALGSVGSSQSLKEVVIALVRDPAFRTRKEGLP